MPLTTLQKYLLGFVFFLILLCSACWSLFAIRNNSLNKKILVNTTASQELINGCKKYPALLKTNLSTDNQDSTPRLLVLNLADKNSIGKLVQSASERQRMENSREVTSVDIRFNNVKHSSLMAWLVDIENNRMRVQEIRLTPSKDGGNVYASAFIQIIR